MNTFCLISTKKLKENQKRFLLNNQISVIDANFIETREIEAEIPPLQKHIIFTSRKSAAIIISKKILTPEHRLFCVGPQTAALLASAGLTITEVRDYAAELSQVIRQDYAHNAFTFFCGTSRMDELPQSLANAGISCREVPVYETLPTPVSINTQPDGILFFSPSAINSFLMNNTLGQVPCFCIGSTTAAALNFHTGPVIIAQKPSVENVIIQAIKYFNNSKS